jgi:hypothetical protein
VSQSAHLLLSAIHALTLIHTVCNNANAYVCATSYTCINNTMFKKLFYTSTDDDDDEDGVLISNEEDPDESYNSNENDALAAQGNLANDDCK